MHILGNKILRHVMTKDQKLTDKMGRTNAWVHNELLYKDYNQHFLFFFLENKKAYYDTSLSYKGESQKYLHFSINGLEEQPRIKLKRGCMKFLE